jgi:hypothetical protein
LEVLTSTRRWRVGGFAVAFTQRTHSQRAIGVMPFHISRICFGAAARACIKLVGMSGSGQSVVSSIVTGTLSPA